MLKSPSTGLTSVFGVAIVLKFGLPMFEVLISWRCWAELNGHAFPGLSVLMNV